MVSTMVVVLWRYLIFCDGEYPVATRRSLGVLVWRQRCAMLCVICRSLHLAVVAAAKLEVSHSKLLNSTLKVAISNTPQAMLCQ